MLRFHLQITTFGRSYPGFARHFYGTVRDVKNKVVFEVLGRVTREEVIKVARRELRERHPGKYGYSLKIAPRTMNL